MATGFDGCCWSWSGWAITGTAAITQPEEMAAKSAVRTAWVNLSSKAAPFMCRGHPHAEACKRVVGKRMGRCRPAERSTRDLQPKLQHRHGNLRTEACGRKGLARPVWLIRRTGSV
ncbi:hypothetical protein ACIPIA_13315, partial [Bosea sp. CER48]|uniref:hypothetical protein n=1 Tax=Bosea sp. CER48 TaxID=3377035 RepID=UPI0038076A9E